MVSETSMAKMLFLVGKERRKLDMWVVLMAKYVIFSLGLDLIILIFRKYWLSGNL